MTDKLPAATAGFVMVPVEPSEKMLDILYHNTPGLSDHLLVAIWAELLAAAAPAQPAVQSEQQPVGKMISNDGDIYWTDCHPPMGTKLYAVPQSVAHPAITHCDNCGFDWLDNGLNPIGCPYCKQPALDVTQLVMASDYDQLKEKLNVTTDCANAYSRMFEEVSEERERVAAERDTLRTQLEEANDALGRKNARISEYAERHLKDSELLDEARELLTGSRNKINYMLQNGEWYEPGRMICRIDAWLEDNGK